MLKLAFYGKGGIGKSTVVSNLAFAWAARGFRVMQIGCDPKADSTSCLQGGKPIPTVLELMRKKGDAFALDDMIRIGDGGVICVEAGGPTPGLGCAGRGIIAALETLEKKGAYEKFTPDIVLYDVLGDVVCGGFSMPMRKGFADFVFIVTSGENMSIHAAANIAMALENFKGRSYASLGGFVLNRRNVKNENEKVAELVSDFDSRVVAALDWSEKIQDAGTIFKTVVAAFPDSSAASQFNIMAGKILEAANPGGAPC